MDRNPDDSPEIMIGQRVVVSWRFVKPERAPLLHESCEIYIGGGSRFCKSL